MLALSSIVEVTVKTYNVPWSLTVRVLVEIVMIRLDSEIQEMSESRGEKVSVSVWLQPASCVQASILKL